jgi:exonuclease SbcC
MSELEQIVTSEKTKVLEDIKQLNEQIKAVQNQISAKANYLDKIKQNENLMADTISKFEQFTQQQLDLEKQLSSRNSEYDLVKDSLNFASKQQASDEINHLTDKLNILKIAYQQAQKLRDESKKKLQEAKAILSADTIKLETTVNALELAHHNYITFIAKAGFGDEADYKTFIMSNEEIEQLTAKIMDYTNACRDNKLTIERLGLETRDKQFKDIVLIQTKQEQIQSEKIALDDAFQAIKARLIINEPIKKALEKHRTKKDEIEKSYMIISNLSKTANGDLAGKQKLAFEQYVQASYFNQIIFEANKRLAIMASGRYELLRKEEASNLKTQSGLELDVLDHYTGKIRTVKSLSGGEAFKSSLALALGLSDVIQSFAGGVEVDTMFIDEGFGSLDSESLEQAIATLSSLTQGNRLVGIISHVSELKERIDKKLVIEKEITGSKIRLVK